MSKIRMGNGDQRRILSSCLTSCRMMIPALPSRRRNGRKHHPSLPRHLAPTCLSRPQRTRTTSAWHGDAGHFHVDVLKTFVLGSAPTTLENVEFKLKPSTLNCALRMDASAANSKGGRVIMPIRPVMLLKYQLEVNNETVCLVWVSHVDPVQTGYTISTPCDLRSVGAEHYPFHSKSNDPQKIQ